MPQKDDFFKRIYMYLNEMVIRIYIICIYKNKKDS